MYICIPCISFVCWCCVETLFCIACIPCKPVHRIPFSARFYAAVQLGGDGNESSSCLIQDRNIGVMGKREQIPTDSNPFDDSEQISVYAFLIMRDNSEITTASHLWSSIIVILILSAIAAFCDKTLCQLIDFIHFTCYKSGAQSAKSELGSFGLGVIPIGCDPQVIRSRVAKKIHFTCIYSMAYIVAWIIESFNTCLRAIRMSFVC